MLDVRGIVAGGVMVLFLGLPVWSAESDLDAKSAKLFKVSWTSLKYSTKTVATNPDAPSVKERQWVSQQDQEHLLLYGRIEFLDPNWVVATSSSGVITRLVDGAGRDVNVPPVPSAQERYYQFPCYGRLLEPVAGSPRAYAVDQLTPTSLTFTLDAGPLQQAGGEIRRIEGYFYAVMPESMEAIEVPFEPSSAWVRLTPDLGIQVEKATCSTWGRNFAYEYSLQRQGQGQVPLVFAGMRQSLPDDSLPPRLLVALRLIGVDGKPLGRPRMGNQLMYGVEDRKARETGIGVTGQVKAFRFIIAVDPNHHKIPFELEHIPLPKP